MTMLEPSKIERDQLEVVAALPGFDELAAAMMPLMIALEDWTKAHPQPRDVTVANVGLAMTEVPSDLVNRLDVEGQRAFDWAEANDLPWNVVMSAIATRLWNLSGDSLDRATAVTEELTDLEQRADAVAEDFRS
ncbi:MAG TPA: hypothetical protein VG650_04110 [Mycobacteriales bacterium]|nr:hypothetical protein [Mycobacteriales bacterium]